MKFNRDLDDLEHYALLLARVAAIYLDGRVGIVEETGRAAPDFAIRAYPDGWSFRIDDTELDVVLVFGTRERERFDLQWLRSDWGGSIRRMLNEIGPAKL
jgi:hypothetical protein